MALSLNAKYGLKRVINASGRMSILGVSAPTDTVMEAMKHGGQNYVEIADLVDKAGDYIAKILGSEAAVVVNSASSGIALSVAAVVTQEIAVQASGCIRTRLPNVISSFSKATTSSTELQLKPWFTLAAADLSKLAMLMKGKLSILKMQLQKILPLFSM